MLQVEILIVILVLLLLGLLLLLSLIVIIVWVVLRQHQNTIPLLILVPFLFTLNILHLYHFLHLFNFRIRIYFMVQKSNDVVKLVPHFQQILFVSFCGIAALAGLSIVLILTFLPTLLRIELENRSIAHGLRVIYFIQVYFNGFLLLQQRILDAAGSICAIDFLLLGVISLGKVDITIKLLPFELDGRESVRALSLILYGKLLGRLV